jgi:hypothetical protein
MSVGILAPGGMFYSISIENSMNHKQHVFNVIAGGYAGVTPETTNEIAMKQEQNTATRGDILWRDK